jgi:hypothetical protein
VAAHFENELDRTEIDNEIERAQEDDEPKTLRFSEVERAEAALERSRERVERSVSALREAFARRTDWRGWVARRPAIFLGGAMVLGFLWGFRHHGGRVSNRR